MLKWLITPTIALGLLVGVPAITTDTHAETATPAATKTPIVKGTKVKDANAAYKIVLNIPQILNMANEQQEARINKRILSDIKYKATIIRQDAVAQMNDAKQEGYPPTPYEYTVDYKQTFSKGPLLSLVIKEYQFSGGAHGLDVHTGVTVDTNQGLLKSLGFFFIDENEAIRMIKTEILEVMKTNKENYHYFADAQNTVKKARNLQYYLSPKGIVVYFSLYELVPYADGIPQYFIPYTEVNKLLKPEYQKILF